MRPQTQPPETQNQSVSSAIPKLTLAVVLALAAVYILWGSTYLAIKIALEGFPPFGMAALRFTLAGFAMYAFLRLRGTPAPTKQQWRDCAILGTLLLAGGNGLVCVAEQSVSSGLAAIAVASMPLWAAAFAGWFGQWPNKRDRWGLAIGFAGVLMLNFGAEFQASFIGAACLILAPMFWAFGSVWSRRLSLPGAWMTAALQMITGAAVLWLLSFASGENFSFDASLRAWTALIYLAVFGSIVAFSAYIYLLSNVRPALATSYAYVNPPIAVLFGVLILSERTTPLEITAMAVIVIGVVLITTQKRAAKS